MIQIWTPRQNEQTDRIKRLKVSPDELRRKWNRIKLRGSGYRRNTQAVQYGMWVQTDYSGCTGCEARQNSQAVSESRWNNQENKQVLRVEPGQLHWLQGSPREYPGYKWAQTDYHAKSLPRLRLQVSQAEHQSISANIPALSVGPEGIPRL